VKDKGQYWSYRLYVVEKRERREGTKNLQEDKFVGRE
jgi:hypothetical protein